MHKQLLSSAIALILVSCAGIFWLLQKADADVLPVPASPIQRCMNLSGALEAPSEGLWGYTIRAEDLLRLREAGFDTVRLPVRWRLVEHDGNHHIEPAQLARVTDVIEQALAADLKIILNAHHYNALNEDPDTHEPRLESVWEQLSRTFAGAPPELMFELINEPHSKMTIARTDALNRRLLEIVRRTNPHRWVVYGTAHWGALEGMLKSAPPYDPKGIIGFHYYEPFEFTHQGAFFVDPPLPTGVSWGTEDDRSAIKRDLAKAAQFRDRHGMPLLLGEFGVYEEVPLHLRADWTRNVRTEAEAAEFGWCHWGFATTFKSYDQNQEDWIYPILRALIP